MIDKFVASAEAALADIPDGATIMIGGFGGAGMPVVLIDALIAQGARNLTIVNNNAGNADTGLAALIAAKRVRKILCSFPRQTDSWHFDKAYRAGELELELVPQGTLAERIRAAGAGIGAFFTPTAFGTDLAKGKETRRIGDRDYVLEYPRPSAPTVGATSPTARRRATSRRSWRWQRSARWSKCARRWSSARSTPKPW